MHPTIEKLLKVQDVDSQAIFLRESIRQRPRELDEDRRKVAAGRAALEAQVALIKKSKMEAAAKELDVKKCDSEIEKLRIALNQAKSNQEYTIYKEQIKKQEENRGNIEEQALLQLTDIDGQEAQRKQIQAQVDELDRILKKKEGEVSELVKSMQEQVARLEAQHAELIQGIDAEQLALYERVLQRHNNFALAKVEGQVCHGCYMSVTTQEITLLKRGQFLQCKSCSRILYLPS